MNVTRRNFLQFCGGATAGVMVSPLPWKLLDDAAIWTQNGTWIAETPRGPVSYRNTTCTLCSAGCGMRLRRVGESTVSAWGVAGHPLSRGRLCPVGLGSAQMLHHPARIGGAVSRIGGDGGDWRLVGTSAAIEEVGRKLAGLRNEQALDRLGILDLRPGRSLSVLYAEFLAAAGGGRSLTVPGGADRAESALGDLMNLSGFVPGYDFDRTRAVISFGVPIFDSWNGVGSSSSVFAHTDGAVTSPESGNAPIVIQVETNGSTSAGRADRWLPIRPGTEAALALGLANLVRQERGLGAQWSPAGIAADDEFWFEYNRLVARFGPEHTARVTGLTPSDLRATSLLLSGPGPVIAIGGGHPGSGPLGQPEELAIWALNLTLGHVGKPGGIVFRPDNASLFGEPKPAPAESLWDIPDGSLDLLLVDGSAPGVVLPRGLMRRKMRGPTSLIVALSPYAAGPAAEADLILPTAAAGEWLDDVPPRRLAAQASYALSPVTAKAPAWSLHPAEALSRLAAVARLPQGESSGKARHEQRIRQRIEALLDRSDGNVFDAETGETKNLAGIAWPRQLHKILSAGGCWTSGTTEGTAPVALRPTTGDIQSAERMSIVAEGRLSLVADDSKRRQASYPLVVMPLGSSLPVRGGALPPVVNKLYRESNLMAGIGKAWLNPATARESGWRSGQRVLLQTAHGESPVLLALDEAVRPGVIMTATGPAPENLGDPAAKTEHNIQEICGAAAGPVWRLEPAALREV